MSTATVVAAPAAAPRTGASKNYVQSVVIGVVLTAISYLVGMWLGWTHSINPLEVFAVFTSYVSTYLCVVERRFNYVAGAISSAAYAWLFIDSSLLASAVLNAYLVPTLAYGWFRWRQDAVTRPVEHVKLKMIPVYLAITGAIWYGATQLITALGGHLAMTDTLILVCTILAQFLLDNKKLENWYVWAAVNVFAIYTYFTTGLNLVGFQYIFFLANVAYGWFMWNKSRKATLPATPALSEAVLADAYQTLASPADLMEEDAPVGAK